MMLWKTRKRLRLKLVYTLLFFSLPLMADVSICINEIMQSNIDNLLVDKEFPDSWVELYNPRSVAVNLRNYSIGEYSDITMGLPWNISENQDLIISAGGYMLIYCDKKAVGHHTNFRLDSGKGSLFLFNSDGHVIDSLNYKKMPAANVAYGRSVDGGMQWQYEVTPTPGIANDGKVANDVLPDPIFSVSGGIISKPTSVIISMPDGDYPSDTRIYITTDGREPTINSPSGVCFNLDISRSTVVRAKLMSNHAISARSVTHSYIFHSRNVTMPIISIVTDYDYIYGDSLGVWAGEQLENMPNYKQRWRRPANVEYFDGDSTWFNQLGVLAVQGNTSREFAQKSLKFYASKHLGTEYYKGTFWKDKPNVQSVKSFVLRNGGGNCFKARISDAYVQKLFGTHTGNMDWQAYTPVIVYLNGAYVGEYAMRERSNEDYISSNYHGLKDIEIGKTATYVLAKNGKASPLFQQFYEKCIRSDVTYEEIATQMDIDNFIEVLIAEMWSKNTDFPWNNVVFWRPSAPGGKWRWILKDLDFINMHKPTSPDYNMFNYMFLTGSRWSWEYMEATKREYYMQFRELYCKMMTYPQFQERFADKLSTYLGDFLKPKVCEALLDSMYSAVNEEVVETYAIYRYHFKDVISFFRICWKYVWSHFQKSYTPNFHKYALSRRTFSINVRRLKFFVHRRSFYMYRHMAHFWGLGRVYPMTITAEDYEISMNGIFLTEGDFDGAYFENRNLHLKADSDDKVWQVTLVHRDGNSQTITFNDDEIIVRLGDYAKDSHDVMRVSWKLVNCIIE